MYIKIGWWNNSILWRTVEKTSIKKPIVVFRNLANTPKNVSSVAMTDTTWLQRSHKVYKTSKPGPWIIQDVSSCDPKCTKCLHFVKCTKVYTLWSVQNVYTLWSAQNVYTLWSAQNVYTLWSVQNVYTLWSAQNVYSFAINI